MALDGFSSMLGVLQGMAEQVVEVTPAALEAAGNEVAGAAMILLSAQSHEPGTPTPSPPGMPPAQISGALTASVVPGQVEATGDGEFTVEVGPTIEYARIQELGGVSGKNHRTVLPPRPYMAPALEAIQPEVADAFDTAWSEALG